MSSDRPTGVAADLLDAATVEGGRASRSAQAQLDYWARLGRSVDMHQTATRRRIEAAVTGDVDTRDLSVEETAC